MTTLHPHQEHSLDWREEAQALTDKKITVIPEDWDESMMLKTALANCAARNRLGWNPRNWAIETDGHWYMADAAVSMMAQTVIDKLAFGSPDKSREGYREEFRNDEYVLSFWHKPENKPYCAMGYFTINPAW